jgi:hypothetical protein
MAVAMLGGLLSMAWYVLTALGLLRLGRAAETSKGSDVDCWV